MQQNDVMRKLTMKEAVELIAEFKRNGQSPKVTILMSSDKPYEGVLEHLCEVLSGTGEHREIPLEHVAEFPAWLILKAADIVAEWDDGARMVFMSTQEPPPSGYYDDEDDYDDDDDYEDDDLYEPIPDCPNCAEGFGLVIGMLVADLLNAPNFPDMRLCVPLAECDKCGHRWWKTFV